MKWGNCQNPQIIMKTTISMDNMLPTGTTHPMSGGIIPDKIPGIIARFVRFFKGV